MAWGAPPIKAGPAGKTGGFGYKVPGALRGAKPNAGPRQSAIAHHMGAPKAPVSHPKAAAKPKAAPRPPKPAGAPKSIGNLNQGDVHNRAVTLSRLERNASLAPLQTQATEIKGNEAGVQANYAKLVGGENEQFQKIGEQQAASAKTFQNQMAENALQQGKAIETAGQTGASMTGGYASPELRAQLLGEAQLAGQQGGAGNQFAQNVATTGAANIANMRGAAALNALGGSQAVSNVFQKQLGANQQAQQGVLAKVGPRAAELEEKIGQANFADQAAKAKLASEGVKLNLAAEKNKLYGKSIEGANFARRADAESKRAATKLGFAKLEGDERQRKINNQINSGKLRVSELSAQDKSAYDKWKQSQPGSVALSASAIKFVDGVAKAESYARAHVTHPKHGHEEVENVRKELRGKNISADEISAALNKLVYGHVGPGDAKRAKALGITKATNPSWFG